MEHNNTVYIPYTDVQNNLTTLYHPQNTTHYKYTPFGEPLFPGEPRFPWTFASYHYDSDTQLYYSLHRYYDPQLMTWISQDPLGDVDSINRYQYCHNNPFRYSDPDGLISQEELYRFGRDTYNGASDVYHGMNDSFRWWSIDRSSTLYSYGMTGAMAPYRYLTAGDNWRDALNQDFENFHKFWYGYFTTTQASRGMLDRRAANNPTYINTVENMKVFWDLAAWTAASELAAAANAVRNGTMILNRGFSNFTRGTTTTESSCLRTTGSLSSTVEKTSHIRVNPLDNTQYTAKVLRQMQPHPRTGQPDLHGFPRIVDNYARYGKTNIISGKDGLQYKRISLAGSYQGKNGNFEWIVRSDGSINHRLFTPYKP